MPRRLGLRRTSPNVTTSPGRPRGCTRRSGYPGRGEVRAASAVRCLEGRAVRLRPGRFRAGSKAPDVVIVDVRVLFALDDVDEVRVQVVLCEPVPAPHLVE